jgi:hypothetical protein
MDKQLPSWDEWIANNTGSMGKSNVGGYTTETRDMMKRTPKMKPPKYGGMKSGLGQDLAGFHTALRDAYKRENK